MKLVPGCIEAGPLKIYQSPGYNYLFNRVTGDFARWGKTRDDDPEFSPVGPEILDIEIVTDGCVGPGMNLKNSDKNISENPGKTDRGGPCCFCYKGNKATPPTNMSLETFIKIFDSMPQTLTQIAFGITSVQANPDFFAMMEYCREFGVIPNYTTAGADLTDEIVQETARLCGAVAVSAYEADKNVCYDAVKRFTDAGMTQCNIHVLASRETLGFVYEVLEDVKTDPRLAKLNAIVFLGLKPKGRAKGKFFPVTQKEFDNLVASCLAEGIRFGFDSCSAPRFEDYVKRADLKEGQRAAFLSSSDSCESGLASSYINVEGKFYPCSFGEDMAPFEDGISCLETDNFMDVWDHPRVAAWRKELIGSAVNGCRQCLLYSEINA